jgi:hypothetical protein
MLIDIHPKDLNRAAGSARDAVYHPQRRCFSRSIRSQKTEANSRRNLQVQISYG